MRITRKPLEISVLLQENVFCLTGTVGRKRKWLIIVWADWAQLTKALQYLFHESMVILAGYIYCFSLFPHVNFSLLFFFFFLKGEVWGWNQYRVFQIETDSVLVLVWGKTVKGGRENMALAPLLWTLLAGVNSLSFSFLDLKKKKKIFWCQWNCGLERLASSCFAFVQSQAKNHVSLLYAFAGTNSAKFSNIGITAKVFACITYYIRTYMYVSHPLMQGFMHIFCYLYLLLQHYHLFQQNCTRLEMFKAYWQHWCNPLWLTRLKAPTNQLRPVGLRKYDMCLMLEWDGNAVHGNGGGGGSGINDSIWLYVVHSK